MNQQDDRRQDESCPADPGPAQSEPSAHYHVIYNTAFDVEVRVFCEDKPGARAKLIVRQGENVVWVYEEKMKALSALIHKALTDYRRRKKDVKPSPKRRRKGE